MKFWGYFGLIFLSERNVTSDKIDGSYYYCFFFCFFFGEFAKQRAPGRKGYVTLVESQNDFAFPGNLSHSRHCIKKKLPFEETFVWRARETKKNARLWRDQMLRNFGRIPKFRLSQVVSKICTRNIYKKLNGNF